MKFKKVIIIILFFFVITICSPNILINAEDKVIVTVTPDQSFSTNSIIVMMKHDVSLKIKDYTCDDFAEVMPDKIEDLDPYTYENIVKYFKNEPLDIDVNYLNINTFRRSFCLRWNKEFTKSEIIEKIEILQKRNDIYCVQPNYLYEYQSSDQTKSVDSNYDYVSPEIWTNYYYIEVLAKDAKHYFDDFGNREYLLEAKLIKSYDELVDSENEVDEYLNEIKDNDVFKFVVPEIIFNDLNVGFEYIIKLDFASEVVKTGTYEQIPVLRQAASNKKKFIYVFDEKLYMYSFANMVDKESGNAVSQFYPNSLYTTTFNQYIFTKEYVKCEMPFDFEVEYVTDAGATFINVKIAPEDMEKLERNWETYTYFYYKTGVFMLTGDDVLMFDEYIKLAKEVTVTGHLFEYTEAIGLRNSALERVNAQR